MAQPTRPGNLERGWNDPPIFLYTGQTEAQRQGKRTLLNKRVAYPGMVAQPVVPKGNNTADNGIPNPMSNILLVPPVSQNTPGSTSILPVLPSHGNADTNGVIPIVPPAHDVELESKNDEELWSQVSENLDKALHTTSRITQVKVTEDIRKKLQIFKTMWECNKLSPPVKASMTKLALAIRMRQCDKAHEVHLALMLDYLSEVSQWMVGIKRLIMETRKLPPLTDEELAQLQKDPCKIDTHPAEDRTSLENGSRAVDGTKEDSTEVTAVKDDIDASVQENCQSGITCNSEVIHNGEDIDQSTNAQIVNCSAEEEINKGDSNEENPKPEHKTDT